MTTIEASGDDDKLQHWIKIIGAVRGSKAAKVWYDFKMNTPQGPPSTNSQATALPPTTPPLAGSNSVS
jgi:hypothetical protein